MIPKIKTPRFRGVDCRCRVGLVRVRRRLGERHGRVTGDGRTVQDVRDLGVVTVEVANGGRLERRLRTGVRVDEEARLVDLEVDLRPATGVTREAAGDGGALVARTTTAAATGACALCGQRCRRDRRRQVRLLLDV